VLFLDEPTTGLDPTSRLRMWDVIRELVADGTT
jgi:ABC-2 type transport system ATP-binding protein